MRKNLKEARQKAGMTQKQVAECLNVCERHYKYIEAGKIVGRSQPFIPAKKIINRYVKGIRDLY